jgi:hypothetical protein
LLTRQYLTTTHHVLNRQLPAEEIIISIEAPQHFILCCLRAKKLNTINVRKTNPIYKALNERFPKKIRIECIEKKSGLKGSHIATILSPPL